MKEKKLCAMLVLLFVMASFLFVGETRAAEYSMKSAEIVREGISHALAQKYFANRVAELTKGKAEVKVFYAGVLGNERNYCEQLQLGSLDFAKVMVSNAVAYVPKFAVFAMPYLVRDLDQLYRISDSPAGKMIQEEAEKAGFVILAYWDTGAESIFNSKRPITKPEDLKGLKLRTREAAISIETVNAMGGSGAPLATPEVFTALQTKVFDGGVQDPIGFTLVFKYAEVCKFYSLTEHVIETALLMASKKRFDQYPKEIQDALRQAGKDSTEFFRREVSNQEQKVAMKVMQSKYGVKVNKVDKEPFIKMVEPVQAKYRDQLGAQLVDEIAKLSK
jgi:tripartite ATP-independent transporter DctP family solute receptor